MTWLRCCSEHAKCARMPLKVRLIHCLGHLLLSSSLHGARCSCSVHWIALLGTKGLQSGFRANKPIIIRARYWRAYGYWVIQRRSVCPQIYLK
ncbi:hypothetical protein U1Q18_023073 [Sarracenia purpurea var. burkii]